MARLALVVPLAALLLSACHEAPPAKDERRAVSVQQLTANSGQSAITYAGEIRSAFESQLGFQVAGRIVERAVNAGDTVRAGQVLFRLDGSDYARALDSAAAQTGAAQSAAATQRADLARSRDLLAQGFISQAEFDQQKAATDQAQAQLRAAGAQRGTAAAQVGRTVLTAPRDGVVTQVEGEVGQVVGAGQAVLTFADPSRPEVAVSLSEGGLGPVQRARRLSVTLWSDPSRQYPVTLRSIAGAADPATRTFAARFSIIAPGETLRMGETAELRIEDDRSTNGILVPLTAIAQGHDKAQAWVVDRRTMTVQPRTVKVGQASGDKLTVLSGLRPGETIVTAGIHLLRAGEKVRIAEVPAS
ncbi:efflux RND transporter periplasmic adaptor subunit [Novosphingobium clariflavum]|uniref:Efflux RND transporter periplasmic adaptor subunit n=1 Tax=Novosphingobium clariflavum TaxID=2029884 RepID=A0ABV6SBS7_9SPHN|nr:efflux RND transporter periplasmic adaptor subunit [Novosphingobium clariflavum]